MKYKGLEPWGTLNLVKYKGLGPWGTLNLVKYEGSAAGTHGLSGVRNHANFRAFGFGFKENHKSFRFSVLGFRHQANF